MSENGSNAGTLLLVDDNPGDRELIEIAVESCNDAGVVDCRLVTVTHGLDALHYLRGVGEFSDRLRYPLPDAVLVDLNMPRLNGKELLAEIQKDPPLRRYRVVVLSTSENEEDVLDCYNLGCCAFVKKPMSMKDLEIMISGLLQFWLKVATLPPQKGAALR